MSKNRKWTDEMDAELLKFMEEGRKKGEQVRSLAKKFAEKYPGFDTEQVRTHYYQLLKFKKYKDEGNFKLRSWTNKEDTFILEYIEKHKENKSKLDIFEELSQKLNRNPQAIASRYYILKREQEKAREIETFFKCIESFNLSRVEKFIKDLMEIQQNCENKDIEIFKLQEKIRTLEEEKRELIEKLDNANKIIKKYEKKLKKIANMKKLSFS